jgi:hypothetical protein
MRATSALALLAAALPVAARAEPIRQLLPTTPMVLKDGRIARVQAHAIPLPAGEVAPDPITALAVELLIDRIATDCFLSAQMIGHGERAADAGDPLGGHRLARDRADALRERMLARGLPGSAVASVWDWQHGLRDARVTLWTFRLLEGEDCTGEPLPGPRPLADLPAQVVALEAARSPAEEPPAPPAEARAGAPAPEAPAAAPVVDESRATARAVADAGTPKALTAREPTATPRAPSAATAGRVATPPVATTHAPVARSSGPAGKARIEPAAAPPSGPHRTVAAPPSAPIVESEDALVIVFDADSSYLPAPAARALRRLAGDLESGRRYTFDLESAVAPDSGGAASGPGQATYARWIAERRLARIQELLRHNSRAAELSFRQTFLPDDPSRRVTIRWHALP